MEIFTSDFVFLRSVRIEGKAERVSEAKSEEYFNSRPIGSRIGAAVSVRQSEVVASREVLSVRLVCRVILMQLSVSLSTNISRKERRSSRRRARR